MTNFAQILKGGVGSGRHPNGEAIAPHGIETGKPVSLHYSRNTESSKNFNLPKGMDVGRHLEPHGEYMNVDHDTQLKPPSDKWESGAIHFKNPIVLEHKSTDSKGWKKDLSDKFGGKTGKALSSHLKKIGHDGIITHDKYGLSETINLAGDKRKGAGVKDFS